MHCEYKELIFNGDLVQYIILLVLCFVNIKDVEHQSNTSFSIHLYFLVITTSTASGKPTVHKLYSKSCHHFKFSKFIR